MQPVLPVLQVTECYRLIYELFSQRKNKTKTNAARIAEVSQSQVVFTTSLVLEVMKAEGGRRRRSWGSWWLATVAVRGVWLCWEEVTRTPTGWSREGLGAVSLIRELENKKPACMWNTVFHNFIIIHHNLKDSLSKTLSILEVLTRIRRVEYSNIIHIMQTHKHLIPSSGILQLISVSLIRLLKDLL